ncbi:hypothetical protein EMCRGX_G003740 [Ephydatia muelleri]
MFTDESGLWRCGGRLTNADMPQPSKHPILLETTHPFTTLIVKECHEKVMHNGVRETLSELRSRYWIVRGRSFIRRILHECLVCKKMQGQHYIIPPSPPLPEFRVQQAQPFSSCGVDYAGPLYLKDTSKRFTARRGVPSRVISDNSKTFKSASRLIFKLLESSEVRKYFGNMHLTWDYNLEKTGIVEKLITGRDGVTRGAVVGLSSAKGPVTLRCPLQLLYPLEMSAQGQASNVVTDNVTEPVDAEDSRRSRIEEVSQEMPQVSPERKLDFV